MRPGTDLPVALAVIRELFARGWADDAFLAAHADGADELRAAAEPWTDRARGRRGRHRRAGDLATFAEWYGTTSPAVIRCGWGQERNRNGGVGDDGDPGAAGRRRQVRRARRRLHDEQLRRLGHHGRDADRRAGAADARRQHESARPRADRVRRSAGVGAVRLQLQSARDRARIRTACAQGLEREDLFTVVHEQVMTDTAQYADVVLPATTFLEHYDIAKGYGAYHLHLVQPVIDAVGEARPNHEVFRELGVRLGLSSADDDLGEAGALMDAGVAAARRRCARRVLEGALGAGPGRRTTRSSSSTCMPKTPDGRVHLYPGGARRRGRRSTHYEPDPATARLSAQPDLAGERAHDLVDARRAPAGHRAR